ncbi:MAG TPA: phosphonate ABC transporter ATP-binding protein [Arenibaculum sp.]|nr:phosphonate ABC transporter ATP-binding protein [Arenibaculum sp.]
MLILDHLTCRFGSTTAVDGISLQIPKGQMVGVIGRSGAGKSTMMRSLNLLAHPTRGRILFDGVEVNALRGRALRAWRSRCAMIFQQFNLVERMDVLTNVLIGRANAMGTVRSCLKLFTEAERAMAIQALERLDMAPQALQRADTLSGGQQQRVAIARALLQSPSLVLADEPIASLDPRSAKVVMDALLKINREDGITVLCNLHALDIARQYSDRIIGLAGGRVVFDGPPSALGRAEASEIYGGDYCECVDEDVPCWPDGTPVEVPAAAERTVQVG